MADLTSRRLEKETRKWIARLESEVKSMETAVVLEGLDNAYENVFSYIQDSKHFLDKKDYINAFEAVIYSWGIWETLQRLNLLRKVGK